MTTARELTNHLARLLREEQGAMADFLVQAQTWVTFWTRHMGDGSLWLRFS